MFVNNGRLFVSDNQNQRVLIWNSIPTTNGQPADLVIGHPDFTTTGSVAIGQNEVGGTKNIAVYGNQLFVQETSIGGELRNRILIFPNTISTPSMNITTPLETVNNTTLRVRGNIQLGDRSSTYALQWVKAEVNGQGLGYVTSLGGGRDNGDNLTLYDFFHEFNPGNIPNSDMGNYTLKLVASSFNADTTSLFYFLPFNFDYIRRSLPLTTNKLNISFTVNNNQVQRVKDNIDHFELMTSTDSGKMWKKLSTNISTDKIDINTGQIYLQMTNTLLPGTKYWVKVDSVSKDSNWRQSSNSLIYFVPKKIVKR